MQGKSFLLVLYFTVCIVLPFSYLAKTMKVMMTADMRPVSVQPDYQSGNDTVKTTIYRV